MIPGSCSTRLKAADATMLYSAGQLAGRIKLTASGRPAMMRRSVRKQGSVDSQTVRAFQHSTVGSSSIILQSHIIWALVNQVAIFDYIIPGSQAVGSTLVSLGRVHLGFSMLLHSSVCALLPVHDPSPCSCATSPLLTIASALSGHGTDTLATVPFRHACCLLAC